MTKSENDDTHPPSIDLLALLVLAAGVALCPTVPVSAAPAPRVDICHIPPGNPANFHTIRVSENALPAHLGHGDVLGSCNNICATLCDDGDECTIDEQDDCETNGCRPSEERLPRDCFLGDCYENACDPAVGCLNGPLSEGTSCDDGMACTDNACDGAGTCVVVDQVSDCCTWPDTENQCESSFCNGRYCEDVLGTDRDTCKAVDPLPCLGADQEDGLLCTVEFCDLDTQACAINEEDDLCADPNICTVASCSQSGPAPTGCVYETDIHLCPLGDDCHPLLDCDPAPADEGGGCQYGDLGPDCCVVDADCPQDDNQCTRDRCLNNECVTTELPICPEGYSCVPSDGTCEPDCFTMRDAAGSGDSITACIDACQPYCPAGVCQAKFQNVTLVNQCLIDGDLSACDDIDAYGEQNGCNICPPPEPTGVLCNDTCSSRYGGLVLDGQDWQGTTDPFVPGQYDEVADACANELIAQGCSTSYSILFSACLNEISASPDCVSCVRPSMYGGDCTSCRSCRADLGFAFYTAPADCRMQLALDACEQP